MNEAAYESLMDKYRKSLKPAKRSVKGVWSRDDGAIGTRGGKRHKFQKQRVDSTGANSVGNSANNRRERDSN